MINVSKEFRTQMEYDTNFKQNAEITLSNGTILNLLESDFEVSNNGITESPNMQSFPLGVALGRSIQVELTNYDGRFSTYDFLGATIRLYLTYQLSETVEKIEFGTFTVVAPETYGSTVIITAQDDMYKADQKYKTGLVFPQTVEAVLRDACYNCDIPLYSTSFKNGDFLIDVVPSSSYTYRQVIGWIAMIAGGNARINRQGYLEIISYDFTGLPTIIDGGSFQPWTEAPVLDGGTFNPWTTGDVLDGGSFGDRDKIHVLYSFKNLKVDTDNITITGISTTIKGTDGGEDEEIIHGEDGYVLALENELISGKEQELIELIGKDLVGASFRKFEGDHVAYPLAEFMDLAIVCDANGNAYPTVITDVNFVFFGFTTLKNCAASALRNAGNYPSAPVNTLIQAKKLVHAERTAREAAIQKVNENAEKASGLFRTYVKQGDGSEILYYHDKKTLEESETVMEITSYAIRFSTDGGESYPYAITVDGQTITRLLYAEGINADYIDTGALVIRDSDGNIIFSADIDSQTAYINGNYVQIGGKQIGTVITETVEKETNLLNDNFVWSGTLTRGQQDPDGGSNAVKLTATNTDSYYSANASTNRPIKSTGQIYTFSVWLKADIGAEMEIPIIISLNHVYGTRQEIYVTSEWKRYTISAKVEEISTANQVTIGGWGSFTEDYGADLYIYKPVVTYSNSMPNKELSQEEIFNILTNNGLAKGVYMVDDELYINATYIETGSLAGWVIDKENSTLTSPNGIIVIDAKNEKISINGVEMKAYGNGLIVSNGLTVECGNNDFSDGTDGFQILNIGTVTDGNYLRIDSGYVSQSSSSSKRYKDVKRAISDDDLEPWYNIQPVWAKYKDGYLRKNDIRENVFFPMFIAEDVEEYFPLAVDYANGQSENWNDRVMIPAMFQMIKSQKKHIDELNKRIEKLENFIGGSAYGN